METNENTLLEMQQQMKQLREMLDNQKIVNENLLRNACSRKLDRLRFKSNIPIIAGVAAILCLGAFYNLGMSLAFMIYTLVTMLVCIASTLIINQHLPRLDRDLVSAGEELVKFRKMHADWLKIGIPMLIVWIGLLVWDFFFRQGLTDMGVVIPMLCGIGIGLVIGLLAGFKVRRDILEGTDELLDQIRELRKEN